MNKTKTWKVALIGCGRFGEKRLMSCLSLKDKLELVAICDEDNNKLTKISTKFKLNNISSYLDYKKLFKEQKLDLVIIATPNFLHATIAKTALKNGINVLIEKPIAHTLAAAKILQKLVDKTPDKKNPWIKIGSNHRFIGPLKYLINRVEKKDFGKIYAVQASIGTNANSTQACWFANKLMSGGGALLDNGFHLVEIATSFLEPIDRVTGQINNYHFTKSSVEDNATAILISKTGQKAVLSSSWTQWGDYLHLELWSEKAQIVVRVGLHNDIQINWCDPAKLEVITEFGNTSSHDQELEYLVNCLSNNKIPLPSFSTMLRTQEIIEAVYSGAKQVKWKKI